MILSKPKKSTLFSLIVFLLFTYGIGVWSAINVPSSPVYWYLIPIICIVIALVVTIKVISGYQMIRIEGNNWVLKNLFRRKNQFKSNDIEWWEETEIKTGRSTFKELHIHSQRADVKINFQEHSNYTNIMDFLKKRMPRKQKNRKRMSK